MGEVNAALKEVERLGGQVPDGVQPNHPARGVNRIVDADKGVMELLMPDGVTPRKKFAMVGFAGSTRMMAPFGDPEYAILGMNQLNRFIPRADAWFEIHKEWNTAVVPGTDHAGWLAECGIPVLMAERVPGIPTSVRLPIEALCERFADYWTSTVAYMLGYLTWHIDRLVEDRLKAAPSNGLASAYDVMQLTKSLYEEYEISIFGIDLIVGEEYSNQRPCAEFYIGQALARNITVRIPQASALVKARYRYEFQIEPNDLIKKRDLEGRIAELTKHHQQASEQAVQLHGALQELRYLSELYDLRDRGGEVG